MSETEKKSETQVETTAPGASKLLQVKVLN